MLIVNVGSPVHKSGYSLVRLFISAQRPRMQEVEWTSSYSITLIFGRHLIWWLLIMFAIISPTC